MRWEPRGKEPGFTVGSSLGDYRLERKLGEGGMGDVFVATRGADDRRVALKILKRELAADQTYRRRFVHEVRAAQEVANKHLATIYQAGEADGFPYIVVEYAPGGSLDDRIAASGHLSIQETVRITSEIAAGLDALHAAGVVHRDVKPSNVVFREDGTVLLTDFGLAKGRAYTVLTQPGQVLGTLDYIAPEVIRGARAGPESDIYSLGCLVFECLAGVPPFAGKGLFQVGLAHLEEDPADPCVARNDAPPELGAAVLRALSKEPSERPRTATEYSNVLLVAARSRPE